MLQKAHFSKLRRNLHNYATNRLELIKQSDQALHVSKRAIFAIHRDNIKEAGEKLEHVEKIVRALNKRYQNTSGLLSEGSYKAALEEYVEAKLFFTFITTGRIKEIKDLPINDMTYLAGLCDLPGELYRYAVKTATNHDIKTTKKCAQMAQEIVGELIEFDLTSYLRTKFDQAKQAVQKLEKVVYELSLRS